MAWNGSSATDNVPKKPAAKAPSKLTGVIAGAVVVLASVGAYFFFAESENPQQVVEIERPIQIKEVKPDLAPKAKPSSAEPEKPKELPPQRVGELRDGYRLLPSGRLHRVLGVVTTGVERVTLADRTFNHQSDRMIAQLLTAEFGGTMVGDSESVLRGFNEAFEQSLKEQITVTPEDTPEEKELKEAVLAAREEIKAQMAQGKSAEDVMIETRNQLLELTLYREDLEKQVLTLSKDGMTQEDYDELIGAANKMLEERGSKSIELPHMVADAIEMRVRREEAQRIEREKKLKALTSNTEGED